MGRHEKREPRVELPPCAMVAAKTVRPSRRSLCHLGEPSDQEAVGAVAPAGQCVVTGIDDVVVDPLLSDRQGVDSVGADLLPEVAGALVLEGVDEGTGFRFRPSPGLPLPLVLSLLVPLDEFVLAEWEPSIQALLLRPPVDVSGDPDRAADRLSEGVGNAVENRSIEKIVR